MKVMVSSLVALSFVLGSSAYGMKGNSTFVPLGFGQSNANDQPGQPDNSALDNRSTDLITEQDCLQMNDSKREQLKNQRWQNRINGIWNPESEKADLVVKCVRIDKDQCVLNKLPNILHIKKENTEYELIKGDFGFALYRDISNSVDQTNLLNKGKATLNGGSTITIAKKTHDRPWVKIEISDKNTSENSIIIGWKPEESDLIIYDADYNKPCAFAGHSVHMVNGNSGANKFSKNLTVLADSFVNFGNLHVDNSDCRIISPSIVMFGNLIKNSQTDVVPVSSTPMPNVSNPVSPSQAVGRSNSTGNIGNIPQIERQNDDLILFPNINIEKYIAFCNEYYHSPKDLDLSDFKGFYDYGNISVDNANLEDLEANISGSFEANNVNMHHYNWYNLYFSNEKNVNDLPFKLNEYLQLEQDLKYKVNITSLDGSLGYVNVPSSWPRQSSSNGKSYKFRNQVVDVNIANIGENLIFQNISSTFEERQEQLKNAKNMSFAYVGQDEKGTVVQINNSIEAFIKKIGEGKYEFCDIATGRAFDAEVSKKLADKIQDDFNVLTGQLSRAETITFSKLKDNKREIVLIDNKLINEGGVVAYFNIEGGTLSQKQIAIFIRNIDGTLYFYDTLSENAFVKSVSDKFAYALEQADITIKRPINYVDPNKETPSATTTKTKDGKEKKKKRKK